ncbi:MAG: CbtA family protein [Actinomycetota bacterium]|nr:CbtA family protein [Actinomycetota bacterium]
MPLSDRPRLGELLVRGALAGAAAGLVTSLVAYLLVTPVLDRAIALEGVDGDGLVARETQKLIGMPAGFLFVGIALGMLFALAFHVLPSRAPVWRRATGLALAAFLALALIPQLRYPADPPGVGDPDSIATRTSSYLLAVALGVAVVSAAYGALRTLERHGTPAAVRQSAVVGAAAAVVLLGYAVLPDNDGVVDAPAALVWDFRIRSLGVLALLYALLGGGFGLLAERAGRRKVTEAPAELLL